VCPAAGNPDDTGVKTVVAKCATPVEVFAFAQLNGALHTEEEEKSIVPVSPAIREKPDRKEASHA
jgi:hypothetical protein